MNDSRFFSSRAISARDGFTLVELLGVMAIMAILIAASFSTYTGVNSAMGLSSATQMVLSELTLARQTALTLNEAVQVRFYQFVDSRGGTSVEYQALQTFVIKNGTPIASEKVIYLPPQIMISSNALYSSPLGASMVTSASASDPLLQVNHVGSSYKYVVLQFKPDGTIDPQSLITSGAPATSWYITLFEKKYNGKSSLPNFTTINLDPLNGRIRLFQP